MEKVAKYTSIIKEMLQYVGFLGKRPNDPIKTQVIEDDLKGHYLLFSNGWRGEKRTYGCYLHLDITPDGKVWLQHDGTDLEIALMLIERGVDKQDIVLGFQPPIVRPDTGFAVA